VGRFQVISLSGALSKPELICDVSHNPAGIAEFIGYLKGLGLIDAQGKKIPGFFCCLHDKAVDEMLTEVSRYFSPLILFQIGNERSFAREHLSARQRSLLMFADFGKAWHYAYTNWHDYNHPWAICGSVAAIGEVLSYFRAFPSQRFYQKTLLGSIPK
jgi:folylpolyglutamate synthase/dihydropteroate synthase